MVLLFFAAALLALAPIAAEAQGVEPDPAAGRIPPLHVCPLGSRTGAAREEGRCLRAREGLMPAPPEVRSYFDLGPATSRPLPVEVRGAWRSAYPEDRNDGALWAGRGLSATVTGGVDLRWDRFRVALAPEVAWSANRAFQLPDTTAPGWSPFADPWSVPGWDRFLRPGPRSRTEWSAGDSYAEATAGPVRAGLSWERLRWGPARRYPLLFSGTAPGFAHLYAETARELPVGPGGVSLRTLAGRLEESAWFDADASNDRHRVLAAQAAWRLGFVPGLEVALSTVRHERAPGGVGGSGLGTFSFRLAFPEEGIEAYGEIGRGDLFVNAIAGVSESAHAQVYTLGMTRTDISPGGTHWRFWGELTKQALELPQPTADAAALALRAPAVPQGHTHRGQLLGSWIGPGSNAQTVGLDFPGDEGSLGFFAERVRRDDDTYYRVHQRYYGFHAHDLQWTLGARGEHHLPLAALGGVRAYLEAGVSRRKNRSFVGLDGGRSWSWVREWNGWWDLRLTWFPE
ncbi:MAG: hypothetical protein ACYC6F_08515 [Longimicrobiales bacterium]